MPGLVDKLKNKHFLSLSGNVIMSGIGMLTFAILYHALAPTEMGAWITFQTILLIIDSVRSGFLTTAFIKFYAGAEQQRANEVMGSTWFIGFAITGVFVALNIPAFFALPYIHDVAIRVFIKWFGVTFACMLPYFIATCVVQAEQRFDRLLFIRFVTQLVFVGTVSVLIFLHKMSLANVVYANLASAVVTSVVAIALGFTRLTMFAKRTKAVTLELFNFGKYSVGSSLSSSLFGKSDVLIIRTMLGDGAVAVYALGQKFMELVEIPLRSFCATAMPSLASAYNRNNREEVIFILKKYAGMLSVLLVPACIVTVLLADVLISIVGGGKYAGTPIGMQAANVYRLFMTFAILFPADRFLALTLDMIHKPKVNFYKVLIMLAANIIGDITGILIFGNVYGAAITTFIPILIGALIGYYALRKYQPFKFFDIYRTGWIETKWLIHVNWKKLRGQPVR